MTLFLTSLHPVFQQASAFMAQSGEVDGQALFATLIIGLTIFALAVFVGFEIISKVPPTLHTPLMSGSNAISGITVIGAIICAGRTGADGGGAFGTTARVLGVLAVVLATVNVVGGFAVTNRMLVMFKKKK